MAETLGLLIEGEGPDQSVEEIRREYPHEYIVMQVTMYDRLGQPDRGRVLIHERTKKDAFAKSKSMRQKGLAFFFNIPPEERDRYSYLLSAL